MTLAANDVIADRYRLEQILGVGSVGEVYRAQDLLVGGPVALKVLRPHLGRDLEASARFRREALVGGRVDHPNCIGVSDFATCPDGAICLVMELVDGEPLGRAIERERRIPWRRALHIARHVLRGLEHAHARGVVHRDIKPDNVFLCPKDGDPDFARVLDFGIAKLVGGSASSPAITQTGLTVGTPAYLSPEQAAGDPLDGRSDLYSLSAVLFEMLTGRPPFADDNLVKLLGLHAAAPVPALAEVAPGVVVPPGVEALVREGLAKTPADRIASATAYLARIDELLAAPEPDTVAEPELGALLDGRYKLIRMLGRGGMARVYEATHVALGRPVAIKVLDPRLLGDDEARRRFEREAQSSGRLHHPCCVGVTDFGTTADGSPYLAMELVEGITLDDLLAEHPHLPVGRAVRIMRQLLDGLAHAHGQGLVHRDLKPANVMLVGDDVKIVDFGLARMISGDDDRVTSTGIVAGTPSYMSPEQVQDRAFDARTDLYAASVIFFEMLTGRPPFESESAAGILQQHVRAPVPPIADVAPDAIVPAPVEELIRRGLAKRPEDRPANAAEYLAALERAAAPPDGTMELSVSQLSLVAVSPPPLPSTAAASAPTVTKVPITTRIRVPRRLAIAGGVAAAILLVGVIAAVAGSGSSASPPASGTAAAAAAPASDPEPDIEIDPAPAIDPRVDEALQMAADGRGKEAAQRLKKLRTERPDDPHVPLALGRIYRALGWPKQTIEAYRDAVRMAPSLRDDPELIRDLVAQLSSKSHWQLAAKVLENDVGDSARPALAETAAHHKNATVRGRAKKLHDRL